ncbi:MAG: exodeoxyribonuclease VII large subunit [Muribaculaceae bacterium]|nr:exodeoxyribonuclease VII large subunit [Muribaculaceae bacterium]
MNFFDNQSIPAGVPLSQYTAAITNTVANARHLSGVWVIAELSDVRVAGGHCYMELIEKNEAGQTVAKLRANIWRNTYLQLRQKFYSATQRDISNGIKALVRGSATHHSLYGLSFNIIDIDPSYTLGDLERIRQEILQNLQREGVIDMNKKIPFPQAPQRIAVISAEGAAGYGDFMNHLLGNTEGFVFYPALYPCVMQGDKVSESIREALERIEESIDFWDCVVIVRGGGATTDLNGFDEYQLARSVATFKLPVVVGIGHERDRNVLDFVAHTSLKTPTAVAGFFIDRARMAYEKVISLTDKIRTFSSEVMIGEERRLSTIRGLIPQLAIHKVEEARSTLRSLSKQLPLMIQGKIGNQHVKMESLVNVMSNSLKNRTQRERIKIDSIINILQKSGTSSISANAQRISSLESLIKVLDPKNTLRRGYSITRIKGKSIRSLSEVSSGDVIETTLYEGELRSRAILDELGD